jgi:hypothetical protein
LIDATGVPFQRQLPGLAGFDPYLPVTSVCLPVGQFGIFSNVGDEPIELIEIEFAT